MKDDEYKGYYCLLISFCGKVWKILYKVVQSLSYPKETQDFWFCAPDLSCQNVV